MKRVKVGSDFSGVGAFDYALKRVSERKGFEVKNVFACDMDKFARKSYLANHKEPNYYPENVYDREIPTKSLDIYMTSPPCQSFSLAGKRKGKDSANGVLFFNSHEFIRKNKPRFFIFENVKGLLSDDSGKTFQEWVNWLGGKSVNGLPILFKDENAVDYHIYWRVLNSKEHGIPQNRERVFIIGIRDDKDNVFSFPKTEHLTKKLKDVLENEVDEKYFLSEKSIHQLLDGELKTSSSDIKIIGNTHPSGKGMNGNIFDSDGISPTLSTNKGEGIKIKSATKKGFETAFPGDSINYSQPNSETRRGRVGKGVAQTLDTSCNQSTIQHGNIRRLTPLECFRLQDFPDSHVLNAKESEISDSQLYKQAGNSITVRVLEKIIDKLSI